MRRHRLVALVCALLAVLTAGAAARAQTVDPRYRFLTVRTAHFRFHFPEDASDLVAALVPIAERTWDRFAARGLRPPALTDVVVADQSEAPNGFATPLPRNRILLYTAPPAPGSGLNPVAWLEGLFVHEFTHIVHLDRAAGWAAAGHRIFGRTPWLLPNLLLPLWHIEGLATFEESRLPGRPDAGRLNAGDFTVHVAVPAGSGRPMPLDRANGGVTDWPGGLTPYAWGADFHAFLERRHGREAIDRLTERTARSLPWLGPRAFRSVFGTSLGELWRTYTHERIGNAGGSASAGRQEPSPVRRLTRHGHIVGAARFGRARCDTCPAPLAYTVRTPDERPAVYVLRSFDEPPERLVTRYGGTTLAFSEDGTIYFDGLEVRRNTGVYADLYAVDLDTRRVRRLSVEARLQDPDLAPDGRRIAATQHVRPGARALVLVDIADASVRTLAGGDDEVFSAPRWSPDGRLIAAIRQIADRMPELVLVDVDTGDIRPIGSGAIRRWATPAWRKDGAAVVVAMADGDGPFELYEVQIDSRRERRLTSLGTVALWPEVSPDGRSIVFTGYTADGYDLFAIAYPERTDEAASDVATSPVSSWMDDTDGPEASPARAPLPSRAPYRPWTTLLPTGWTPLVTWTDGQVRAGALVDGSDILGYHSWAADVTWAIADDLAGNVPRTTPDWSFRHAYGRWPVQPFLAVGRTTSSVVVRDASGRLARHASRDEEWEAGLMWPFTGYQRTHVLQVSLARVAWNGPGGDRNFSAVRTAWRYSSAHRPGYAISPERGVTVGVAAERIMPALGASASGGRAAVDGRLYLPGAGRHDVVAVRAALATTWGDDLVRSAFAVGGSTAPPAGSLTRDAAALLRGFSDVASAGRHATTLNLDYRFALARPQRGVGTWPALLHSVHAAVVADVAHAWIGTFHLRDFKRSIGGEVAVDLVLGYTLRATVAAGMAWGYDPARRASWTPAPYVRVGHAF